MTTQARVLTTGMYICKPPILYKPQQQQLSCTIRANLSSEKGQLVRQSSKLGCPSWWEYFSVIVLCTLLKMIWMLTPFTC